MKNATAIGVVLALLSSPVLAQGKGSTGKSGVVVSPDSGQGTVTTPKLANPMPAGEKINVFNIGVAAGYPIHPVDKRARLRSIATIAARRFSRSDASWGALLPCYAPTTGGRLGGKSDG